MTKFFRTRKKLKAENANLRSWAHEAEETVLRREAQIHSFVEANRALRAKNLELQDRAIELEGTASNCASEAGDLRRQLEAESDVQHGLLLEVDELREQLRIANRHQCDPIECGPRAALGEAEEKIRRLLGDG